MTQMIELWLFIPKVCMLLSDLSLCEHLWACTITRSTKLFFCLFDIQLHAFSTQATASENM